MNCRRMEELIPLYVGGDLQPDREDAVRAHLKHCQRCSGLAGQYRNGQDWLRSYAAPQPGNEFFDSLRHSVLAEIEKANARPTFLQFFLIGWNRKPLYALAAVLLFIFGALAFYLAYDGGSIQSPPDDRIVKDEPDKQNQEVTPKIENQQQPRLMPRKNAPGIAQTPKRPKAARPMKTGADALIGKEARKELLTEKEPSGMLRIEIQTGDPNIRIIWFTPKPADTSSANPTTETD